MQIKRLKLTNFRSHGQTDFTLDRLNVIRGYNGAGKSSIAMAIELALTGRCQVTDAAGKGADALNILAKDGMVELDLAGETWNGWLSRRQTRSGQSTTMGNNAGKQAMAMIEAHFAKIPVLSAVLNSHRFLELDPKEQKALLANALGSDPVPVPAEVWESNSHGLSAAGMHVVPKFMNSAAEVDQLYDVFYKTRTLVKRELANLGEIKAPEIPADAPSLEESKKKLSAVRLERDKLIQERGHLQSEYLRAMDAYGTAVKKLHEVEDHVLESAELAQLEKIAKSRSQQAALDQQIAALANEISQKRSAVADWKNRPTNCDKCGAALSVDQKEIDLKIAALEVQIMHLDTEHTAKGAERRKLGDADEAQRKLDRHRENSGAWAVANKTVQNGAPAEPDVALLNEQISGLTERISNGEAVIEKLTLLEGAKRQYEHQKNQQDILTIRIASLERLVEYFGDKGPLKAQLVGGKLPAFVERINGVLARFGFHAWLYLDPYKLDVAHLNEAGEFRPHTELALHQLSESEQYRFSIAFQIALAEATGVGLVVIDRADMLTPDSRKLLTAELMESRLEQAFLLSTGEPMEKFPDIPGVAFFDLVNADGITSIRAAQCPAETAYANR